MPEACLPPLSRFPPFRGLDEHDLARIVALARRQSFSRGSFLLREGEPCDAVHFIARGRVRVSKVSVE
ncbi:MAG: hypothetical protein ACP5SI_08900, partial [Chloroflexia bacterium]